MNVFETGASYTCRTCSRRIDISEYGDASVFCTDACTDGPCPSCFVDHGAPAYVSELRVLMERA